MIFQNNANSFLDDKEKMYDFVRISKEEFLESYSYIDEKEYDKTMSEFFNEENKIKISDILYEFQKEHEKIGMFILKNKFSSAYHRIKKDDMLVDYIVGLITSSGEIPSEIEVSFNTDDGYIECVLIKTFMRTYVIVNDGEHGNCCYSVR